MGERTVMGRGGEVQGVNGTERSRRDGVGGEEERERQKQWKE